MSNLQWASVAGTEVKAGDYVLGDSAVVLAVNSVKPGQLPEGARYVDAMLENGEEKRCWGGFLYRVGR